MASFRWLVMFGALWLTQAFPAENSAQRSKLINLAALSPISMTPFVALAPLEVDLSLSTNSSGSIIQHKAMAESWELPEGLKHGLLIFFYGIIIVLSLIGNTLVCRVLLCAKRSAYPTLNLSTGTGTSKLLIVNLAVSDLLLTCFNIPINLVRFVSYDWPFGQFICTAMPIVQSVSAYCSAWTMLVIAFERYRK